LVSGELRGDHAGQPFNGGAQVLGIHLLQLDRNRGFEQWLFTILRLLCPMSEQTASQDPSKAHEGPAFAREAFVTSAAADDLAIKAEDCIPEREDVLIWFVFRSGHIDQPLSLGMAASCTYMETEYSFMADRKLSKRPVLGQSRKLENDPWGRSGLLQ
jgi:hypothetical protein